MTPITAGSLWRGKRRLQLPVKDWPADDQRRWETATQSGGILDPGGEASEWSPVTRRGMEKAYGRWLAWLVSHDLLDPATSVLARVTAQHVSAYAAELRRSVSNATVWSYTHHLATMLDVLAPEKAPAWLWKAVSVLKRSARPSNRKHGRVVPSSALKAYGIELMDGAGQDAGAADLAMAAQFRDGLMIALLAARPVRRRNFTSIEMGTQLMQQGHAYYLRFEAAETKTQREIEVAFPSDLIGYLDRYLTIIRPVLLAQHGRNKTSRAMAQAGAALWVTAWGTKINEATLYLRIVERTRAKFGQSVNPHLFRDCAATSIALTDPDNIAITIHVLGHATLATSERSYNHAKGLEAAALHQAEIATIRRENAREARQATQRNRRRKVRGITTSHVARIRT